MTCAIHSWGGWCYGFRPVVMTEFEFGSRLRWFSIGEAIIDCWIHSRGGWCYGFRPVVMTEFEFGSRLQWFSIGEATISGIIPYLSYPRNLFCEELTSRLSLRAKKRARAWPRGQFLKALNREFLNIPDYLHVTFRRKIDWRFPSRRYNRSFVNLLMFWLIVQDPLRVRPSGEGVV